MPTAHPKVRAARHRPYSIGEVHSLLADLRELATDPDPAAIEVIAAEVPLIAMA